MSDLQHLVATRTGDLTAIASGWLGRGARAVELWGVAGLAARWAPDLEVGHVGHPAVSASASRHAGGAAGAGFPRSGGLHVPITDGGRDLGWVRLVGLSGSGNRRRLVADASRIGGWVGHEADLAALTEALVERQDELLGLVDLLQAARVTDDVDMRAALAENVRSVLRVGSAALVTQDPAGWRVEASPRKDTRNIRTALAQASTTAEARSALGSTRLVFAPSNATGRSFLLVVRPLDGQAVSSPLIRLAEATAELCATLVGQAERHADALERQRLQRQLEFAAEVQGHLLQRPSPRPRGLRVATSYRPADAVGGDLYTVSRHGDETVLAIGDVSGKGVPAALLMAAAKALIGSHARQTTEPAELLARVSADLYDDLERSHAFITLAIARYDATSGTLTVANAGHAPVLLRTEDGVRLLEPADPPIGVVDMPRFSQSELPLAPNDVLLMASDGIAEREDDLGHHFGIDAIAAVLDAGSTEPRRLVSRLQAAADRFARDRAPGDDTTLVVAQVKPGAAA